MSNKQIQTTGHQQDLPPAHSPRQSLTRKQFFGGIIGLLVFLVVLLKWGANSDDSKNNVPPNIAPQSSMREVLALDTTYQLLSTQNFGSFIKASAQYPRDIETSGKFILVRVIIENNSHQEFNLKDWDIILIDDDKREYEPTHDDAQHYAPENEDCHYKDFSPGISRTCALMYEVASDTIQL